MLLFFFFFSRLDANCWPARLLCQVEQLVHFAPKRTRTDERKNRPKMPSPLWPQSCLSAPHTQTHTQTHLSWPAASSTSKTHSAACLSTNLASSTAHSAGPNPPIFHLSFSLSRKLEAPVAQKRLAGFPPQRPAFLVRVVEGPRGCIF